MNNGVQVVGRVNARSLAGCGGCVRVCGGCVCPLQVEVYFVFS